MTSWSPVWRVSINSVEYTDVILSTLSINSGRTDINVQPIAGYCSIDILNTDQSAITVEINDGLTIEIKDSTGTYVPIFGGAVSDVAIEVARSGSTGYTQVTRVVALGAIARLPKATTLGVLSHDFDGNQIYTILSALLLGTWNDVPAATTWNTYDATTTWNEAENNGLGEIDQPGNFELYQRSSSLTDVYSLVSGLASSGLGYLYEDSSGRISYADSDHRTTYFAANGYTILSANEAQAVGIKLATRAGDIKNDVALTYGNNYGSEVTATDAVSIATYGTLKAIVNTTVRGAVDAQAQADRYIALRAYPQGKLDRITYQLVNPEISDADRDALLSIFMGLPVQLDDLPPNMNDGQFQGFVEGWSFQASFNTLTISVNISPLAFSTVAMKWDDVSASETWNTLSATMTWDEATIVA
ncbi:hypothetical protein UFOVP1278_17 [uncultured Caudovirales phage]|uniref:Uncharacterized protein n=1 Tax=uncultured Caudovirales phage TaxID=2100421 RepID=A0A6J5RCR5_9CAUD|nr:hypothetical protein UFOVP1278_17 [uncultured Caudovirales phage]